MMNSWPAFQARYIGKLRPAPDLRGMIQAFLPSAASMSAWQVWVSATPAGTGSENSLVGWSSWMKIVTWGPRKGAHLVRNATVSGSRLVATHNAMRGVAAMLLSRSFFDDLKAVNYISLIHLPP